MLRNILITALLLVFIVVTTFGQDTLAVDPGKEKGAWKKDHIPFKATILSTLLPGAGQIYNHKYWKAPIVWAGIGISVYFIVDNNKNFQHYKDAYLLSLDGNNPYEGEYSSSQLLSITDQYRRWRDLSYVVAGFIYLLNIMDATVDGYLVSFDVSEDLSLNLRPYSDFTTYPINGLTLSLSL